MSRNRASLYALSVAILALIAYKTKMAQEEIALWEAVIGFGYVAGVSALATVKTWPRKSKADEDV
jgi:hypothetical protein